MQAWQTHLRPDAICQLDSLADLPQIDIVITSCSCYVPTPSMAACVVNKFKMRHNVLTYHLGGIGCSSSLVCIDLVQRMLKVRAQAV